MAKPKNLDLIGEDEESAVGKISSALNKEQIVFLLKPYRIEIHRLREALRIISSISIANIELSKEKLEGE